MRFSQKRFARPIEKVLRSAIANAEQKNSGMDVEDLYVAEAFVDIGPTKGRKRIRPAPMGRAHYQMRRLSHITVRVSDGQGS